jgi:hypothetical protein
LKSIAYRKAEAGAGYRGLHSRVFPHGKIPLRCPSPRLRSPVEGAGLVELVQVMITQIESSTDVRPCKKRCHSLMTQIALWYLMNIQKLFLSVDALPILLCSIMSKIEQ